MSAHQCPHCQNLLMSYGAYERHVVGGCPAAAGSAPPKLGNSFEIRINGKVLLSAFIRDQATDNSSMLTLLKELVAMLEAPEESDPDIDGQNDNNPATGSKRNDHE